MVRGRLPHSLANSMPLTVARASLKAPVTLVASATPSVRLRMLRGSAFDLVVV
jgi:hypothetical protein